MSPTAWLEQWKAIWPLVLPEAEVQAVLSLSEEDSWCKAADEIATIINSSVLGEKMFAMAAREVISTQVRGIIAKAVDELSQQSHLGEKDIIASKNACKSSLDNLANIDMLPERRTITLSYRGWDFPWKIRSIEEELDVRFHVALRGWWAELEQMPLLPGEAELCGSTKGLKVKGFERTLTKSAEQARKYISTVIKMQECVDGDAVEVRV